MAYSCNPFRESLLQLQANMAYSLPSLWGIPTAAVSCNTACRAAQAPRQIADLLNNLGATERRRAAAACASWLTAAVPMENTLLQL